MPPDPTQQRYSFVVSSVCCGQVNPVFTPEQVEWLTRTFMSGAQGGERIRDKKAAKLMKKELFEDVLILS